jgi:hypothetical protein
MVFAREDDARRVLDVLPGAQRRTNVRRQRARPKRFAKYGLTLHPKKTRLVQFNRPRPTDRDGGPRGPRPGTFDLLGFTPARPDLLGGIDVGHYWGRTRRGGCRALRRPTLVRRDSPGAVKRKTAADRFSRALRRIAEWCRTHRHHAVKEQCPQVRTSEGAGRPGRALCLKVQGHFGYYGITGNSKALDNFRYRVRHVWRKWLSRRSQTAQIKWDRFALLPGALAPDVGPARCAGEQRYPLPPARLAHPLRVT